MRSSVLAAAIVWGCVLTVLTEFLSLFHALKPAWLALAWSLVLLLAIGAVARIRKIDDAPPIRFSPFQWALLTCLGLIALTTFIIAIVAAPNNRDSMAYHMARIMHWAQNHSIAHYQTHVLWQLEHNPWAEFAITHSVILTGNDYFANTIQWFAMTGSAIGISLIAGLLGCSAQGQLYAAVFSATLPMGILQSTSTQNDYVLSFWMICFVYFGMLARTRAAVHYSAAIGSSLGLAILTKPIAYLYAFPFLIYFVFTLSAPELRGRFLRSLLIGFLVLALNGGHYFRNYQVFGSVLNSGEIRYTNEITTPAVMASNALRNFALHIGTPSEAINSRLTSLFEKLHVLTGLSSSDPRTTFLDTKFGVNMLTNNEDSAGNPVHAVLICISFFLVLRLPVFRQNALVKHYLIALIAAFLFFCLVLKWQPWHSRLHLPLFVLASSIVALVLDRVHMPHLAEPVMVGLLFLAIPWLLFNGMRPCISFWGHPSIFESERTSQYFTAEPSLLKSYRDTAEKIRAEGCSNIGLRMEGSDFEYPFWTMLHTYCAHMPRIEHIAVQNVSARIGLANFSYLTEVTMHNKGLKYLRREILTEK